MCQNRLCGCGTGVTLFLSSSRPRSRSCSTQLLANVQPQNAPLAGLARALPLMALAPRRARYTPDAPRRDKRVERARHLRICSARLVGGRAS